MAKSAFSKVFMLSLIGALTFSCSSTKETTNTSQGERSEQTQERGRKRPTATEAIAEMDTDGDGKLSKSEVKGPLLNSFSKVDTDDDGFLTKEELENIPEQQQQGGRPQRR